MKNFAISLLLLASAGCSHSASVVEPVPTPDTVALVEGLRMFEDGRYEQARDRLNVSARSGSANIRAESFLYLNALEMEMGNYAAAHAHLDRYHTETVRLLRAAADASARMERQAARLRRDMMWGGAAVVAIVGAGLAVIGRRRRSSASQDSGTEVSQDFHDGDALARAEVFRRTAVWNEIAELAAQRPGREARVLTLLRQQALDAALEEHFADFVARLRALCPALTAGDVKLCCLSLLPLSTFGKAVCFGSTESNIVKQRKHTIKKKLPLAVFAFVFSPRE